MIFSKIAIQTTKHSGEGEGQCHQISQRKGLSIANVLNDIISKNLNHL